MLKGFDLQSFLCSWSILPIDRYFVLKKLTALESVTSFALGMDVLFIEQRAFFGSGNKVSCINIVSPVLPFTTGDTLDISVFVSIPKADEF